MNGVKQIQIQIYIYMYVCNMFTVLHKHMLLLFIIIIFYNVLLKFHHHLIQTKMKRCHQPILIRVLQEGRGRKPHLFSSLPSLLFSAIQTNFQIKKDHSYLNKVKITRTNQLGERQTDRHSRFLMDNGSGIDT